MLDLPRAWPKRIALVALAIAFVAAGGNHFVNPDFFLAIMPPYLPAHLELVRLSGAFEIAGGIGVLIPAWRSAAGWGLVALLIAVFPANLYVATENLSVPQGVPGAGNALVNWIRLPFQPLFILWAWWYTRPDPES